VVIEARMAFCHKHKEGAIRISGFLVGAARFELATHSPPDFQESKHFLKNFANRTQIDPNEINGLLGGCKPKICTVRDSAAEY
jgi:hypothetical protein